MSSDPHADLLAACGRGDRGALSAIYQREAAAMLGVAIRIVRRRELAEEAVHDAFVQIWRHAGRFDPTLGSGRGWVFAIVRNRAINMLRDTSREQPTEAPLLEALANADDVLSEYQNRIADESALKTCLERLDPRRRLGVLLAYVEGLSHGEIAARLGVPLGTAKSWIRRSLIDLRECLA
jgi:RNA polymerase sigma-70 factor (ECF subfamily)